MPACATRGFGLALAAQIVDTPTASPSWAFRARDDVKQGSWLRQRRGARLQTHGQARRIFRLDGCCPAVCGGASPWRASCTSRTIGRTRRSRGPARPTEKNPQTAKARRRVGPTRARRPAKSYDFYNLPKFEVVIPERKRTSGPTRNPCPETRRGTYVLQAGSYKNFADADRVRAQLAASGRRIQGAKVSVDNGHLARIRIGTISKLDDSTAAAKSSRKRTSMCW